MSNLPLGPQDEPTSGARLDVDKKSTVVSKKPPLIWHNILFMTITPVVAAVLTPIYLYQHGSTWGLWAFFVVCFAISNMSITTGYHRFFAHRSYEVHPFIEFLYIFVGAGAFQGSVLQWATDHRRHHREVDGEADPYSISKGFWFAHVTWMFRKDPNFDGYAKDLAKNKFIAFQHKYYVLLAVIMGFIVPGVVGQALGFGFWGGVLIGGALRIVLTQHSTFLINSAAHCFGRQTYNDKHTARDSIIMAFLTFGEGYHNFHHSFQADYRNGTRWYHWDPTKWWIRMLALIGLARKLKRAQKEEILKTRLAMEERFLLAKGASRERVQALKLRIEEAQIQVRQLRETYRTKKREFAERGRNWKKLMRAEIRMAEIEFKSAYGQWRTYRRAVKQTASAA